MNDCLFCGIAEGHIYSAKVYEDNETLAFLDIKPLTYGHTLVIPKKHCENIYDIDVGTLAKVSLVGKNIAEKMKNNLHAEGINFLQSNGKISGQVISHYHLHVIPRYEGDGLILLEGGKETVEMEQLKQTAEKIKN